MQKECVERLTFIFFFFNDTATTEIYTLSLHDALPISKSRAARISNWERRAASSFAGALMLPPKVASCLAQLSRIWTARPQDRKSTRLNSSHANISYAVFCLKKKTQNQNLHTRRRFHHA